MARFHVKRKSVSETVNILGRRLYNLVPTARLCCSWCNPVCLPYTKSCFCKQNKKSNQTSSLHCTQYPHPPFQHKSFFSHGFTKQSILQQCWLTAFLLPSPAPKLWIQSGNWSDLRKLCSKCLVVFLSWVSLPTSFKRSSSTAKEVAAASDLVLSAVNYTLREPGCPCQSRLKDDPCLQIDPCLFWPNGMLQSAESSRREKEEHQMPSNHRIAISGELHSVECHPVTRKTIFLNQDLNTKVILNTQLMLSCQSAKAMAATPHKAAFSCEVVFRVITEE